MTTAHEELALNPFEPGFFENPYDQYRRLRETRPVHKNALDAWTLTRWEDVGRLVRDPSLSVEERNANAPRDGSLFAEGERAERGSLAILNLDPPRHTRIRRLVQQAFTPRRVEALIPDVQRYVDDILDAAAERGEMDVISDLAFPLPFAVISDMLGMPDADRHAVRGWAHTITRSLEPLTTKEEMPELLAAQAAMVEHVNEAIAWKRAHPADDLMSAMIAAEQEGDRLSTEELIAQVVLIYVAGHETTVNLIGNGINALLRNPAQLELLRAQPELIGNAVDELLRYDSPVQFTRRITLEPIEIDGHHIEKGALVFGLAGAANRDPAHFGPTVDELDITRRDAPHHYSFGGGIHHCLGAVLARTEARVAVGSFAQRFPAAARVTDEEAWNGRMVLRGLDTLPVTLQ